MLAAQQPKEGIVRNVRLVMVVRWLANMAAAFAIAPILAVAAIGTIPVTRDLAHALRGDAPRNIIAIAQIRACHHVIAVAAAILGAVLTVRHGVTYPGTPACFLLATAHCYASAVGRDAARILGEEPRR